MKRTKRILSLLLALALGLALLIPAAAADDIDPYAPIITKQPARSVYRLTDQELKLEIEATLPEGCDSLSIAWYDYDWQPGDTMPPVATGASVLIPIDPGDVNIMDNWNILFRTINYYAVVTSTYTDSDGQEQTVSVKSDAAEVTVLLALGKLVADIWEYAQNGNGPLFGIAVLAPGFPVVFPALALALLPVYFFIYLLSLMS